MADSIMLWHSSVQVDPANFLLLAKAVALMAIVYSAGWIVTFRLKTDRSRPGLIIKRCGQAMKNLSQAFVLFLPLLFANCLFMYLATATNRPLMDSDFAAIDAGLGFDWVSTVRLLNSSPAAASILMYTYHVVGQLMVLILFFLALSPYSDDLMEYIAVIAVSAVFTGVLMLAFPTAGAYAFYKPSHEVYSNFTGVGGLLHLQTLNDLRSGNPFLFQMSKVTGLVSFPSFHCALGVMLVYGFRRIRWLACFVGMVIAIMIPATIPEGGHHFSDAIAGILVGFASIAIVRALSPKRRYAISLVAN